MATKEETTRFATGAPVAVPRMTRALLATIPPHLWPDYQRHMSRDEQIKVFSEYKLWHAGTDKVKLCVPCKDGEYHGVAKETYADGTPSLIVHYRMGKMHGPWIQFFPNGQKQSQANYVDGMPHGERKQWVSTGQLQVLEYWDHGMRCGERRVWSVDGRLASYERWMDQGFCKKSVKYADSADSKWRESRHYADGQLTKYKLWDERGDLVKQEVYDTKEKRHGECLYWRHGGQVVARVIFDHGRKVSEQVVDAYGNNTHDV